jgi:uncharacterized protein (TIGR03435 family)
MSRTCSALLITACLLTAQVAPSPQLEFEVASIKPIEATYDRPGPVTCSQGSFAASGVPARFLIEWAFDIRTDFSLPAWASLSGEKYNVEAKAAGPVSLADCKLMVQHLLADRFQLSLHNETRETNVYFMTLTKSERRLRELKADDRAAESDGVFLNGQKLRTAAWEPWMIAGYLSGLPGIGRPVVDRTGLKGLYQFTLDFRGDRGELFTTVQEQLGLRLEPGKAPVEFTVIDHLARPSGN